MTRVIVRGLHCVCSHRLDNPSATPVLLLHGAGGSVRHWSWLVDVLPSRYAPIAVDLPGHGASHGRVPLSLEEAVRRVDSALRELGVTDALTVVAHSIGGMIALLLAIQRPERVARLALIGTAARIRPHPTLLRAMADGIADAEFLRGAFAPDVPADRFDVVLDDMAQVRTAQADDFMGVSKRDLGPRLGEVRAPTLVIVARGDRVVSPRRSRALAAAVPAARLSTLDGGHYLHVERPDEVMALLSEELL